MTRGLMASRALRLGCLACLGAGLALAPAAHASDEPAPARSLTPDERARELYLRGDRLYAEGSYDEAVVAFEKAYELSQRPALLYDMANALERLGRYEEALRRLQDYVPYAPEHQRGSVLKRIRSLESRAEEQRRREGAAPPPASSRNTPPGVDEPSVPPPPEPPAPPILGYAIGGAGIASLGLGLVFGLSASSARSDAEAQCVSNGAGTYCPKSVESLLSDADGRALVADIAFGVGLVAVGVGAYLVLTHDPEAGTSTELRTAATPGGGSMSLVTTF
jgi:tetratricopeptide (TPR) repeat protein